MKYSSEPLKLREIFKFPSPEFSKCSIENPEDYKKIVHGPAYRDFTPRTISGMKKESILQALDWLSDTLFEYIQAENVNFDEWHKKTCIEFCNRIEKLYGSIPYGKAQKIVNMSFKYLYCFDDAQKYSRQFQECHMALDSYTLEWFMRFILNDKEHKHIKKTRIVETSWSNLVCGNNDQEEYSYLWFQSQIKSFLASDRNKVYVDENNKKLHPFQAEFYIWPEIQLHMAMEGLYSQGEYDKSKKTEFKKMSVKEKTIELQKLLDNIINSV